LYGKKLDCKKWMARRNITKFILFLMINLDFHGFVTGFLNTLVSFLKAIQRKHNQQFAKSQRNHYQ